MTAINRLTVYDLEEFGTKPSMNNYQLIATKSAIYPGRETPLGLAYCALKLNGEAGELAEHVGKAMRDDNFMLVQELTAERRLSLIKEVGDVLWYVAAICNELNITLAEAAETNLEKLFDRGERGKLQGSGDNR